MILTGLVAVCLSLGVAAILIIDGAKGAGIADGVRIGTVDVGGLSSGEARTRVLVALYANVRKPIVATYGGRRFVFKPAHARALLDVDGSVDAAMDRTHAGNPFTRVFDTSDPRGTVRPVVSFSQAGVDSFVARVAKRVGRPARNADIGWHDGKLEATKALKGIQVRRAALESAIVSALANPPARRTVKVPVKVTERADRNLQDLAKRYPTVIAVDRDAKVLRLYKHLQLAKRYKVAVGQAGLETAAGRYKIAEKTVDPDWHVPMSDWAGDLAGRTIPAGDPQNPLEARWMGFHDGQGIHGTADLASLGTAASHGCIRMSVPAVKRLFREVKVGTPLFLQ